MNTDKLKKAFDKARIASENRGIIIGILGRVNSDGSISLEVANRKGFVYVRIGPPNGQQTTIADNTANVQLIANMPVRMTRKQGVLVIKDTSTATNTTVIPDNSTNSFGVPFHTHMDGTGLEYIIEGLRIEHGLVRPIGGYKVKVLPFRYKVGITWKTYAGEEYDVAPYNQPTTTGKWYWVLFTVEPITNVLEVFNGTEENYATPLTLTMLNSIDISNNIPLGAIKVRADDSSITDITKYYDARQWISGNNEYLEYLTDVVLDNPIGGQSLIFDHDGQFWENRNLDHLYITDWNEAVDDRIGNLFADSSTINVVYDDAGNAVTLDVIPSAIDHGTLGGLADDDHTQYLRTDGSRASTTNPQVFQINPQAPFYDREMIDVLGDHFTTPTSDYPAGWTDTTPASTGTFVSDGWWRITNIHTTGWTYRKESDYSADLPPHGGDNLGVLFGPIQISDQYLDDDLTYYFGYYRDSSGIDLNTFNRIAVNWDNTLQKWQVRHETKNGTTQTNGYWYPLSFPPLVQNIWLRVTYNDLTGYALGYIGTDQNPLSHSLLGNIDMAGMGSWGDGWIQIHSVRTNVHLGVDILLIGGVDYTVFDNASLNTPPAPPVISVYGHTHPSTDITDFTEAVQDIMAGILIDGGMMDWTYNDALDLFSVTIVDGGVTNLKLADMAQATVKGRASGAGTGQPQDLTSAELATILGTSLTSGSLSDFVEAVQDVVGAILIDAGDMDWTYTDGSNTLSAIIAADAVSNTKMANMVQGAVKGRQLAGGTGDPEDLTPAQLNTIIGSVDLTMANGIKISSDELRARDSGGLKLFEDGGTMGLTVNDDGTISANRPIILFENANYPYILFGRSNVRYGQLTWDDPTGEALFQSYNREFPFAVDALHFRVLTLDGTERMRINTIGMGLGTNNPQGKLHAYDGIGGKLVGGKSGINGSAQTIIPDGTGDVTARLLINYVVLVSDGNGTAQVTSLLNNTGADLYSLGGNTLRMTVNANGSVTIARTAGSLTYSIFYDIIWI